MKFDTKHFDKYREGSCLEVKKAKGGLPDSLWSTYSAMANCHGGVILLGAAERADGSFEATGLDDAEKLRKDFWNTINNGKKVSLNLLTDDDVKVYELNGNAILAIHIPKARREDKPIYPDRTILTLVFRKKQAEKTSGKNKRKNRNFQDSRQ